MPKLPDLCYSIHRDLAVAPKLPHVQTISMVKTVSSFWSPKSFGDHGLPFILQRMSDRGEGGFLNALYLLFQQTPSQP